MNKDNIFLEFLRACSEYDAKLKSLFGRFLSIIVDENIIEEIKAKKRKIPLFFNILYVFNNYRNEVKNSTLLKEILNLEINGTFLREDFIQFVNKSFNWKLETKAIQAVEAEKYCYDFGRIDVFIEGENFVLIIENKIDAGDQERQLERYIAFARTYKKDIYVIYLTKFGYEPSEYSLTKSLRNELGQQFRTLKHGNIGLWIEQLLEKDQYACIKTNQAYKYLYSGLLQFMHTELLLSNMAEEDNVTKDTIKKILMEHSFIDSKTSLSDMEEYRDIFSNATAVINELIKEKECDNFIKENKIEEYFNFAHGIVESVMKECDKQGIKYISSPVKNFNQFRDEFLENFYDCYYLDLLEIKVNEKLPEVIIEIGYEDNEFYGTYFGIYDESEPKNSTFEKILETRIKPCFKDEKHCEYYCEYNDNCWRCSYSFKPSKEKSYAQKIVQDIMKLCDLCKSK